MSVDPVDRMANLERDVRSLRRWLLALGMLFVATVAVAATEEPQELTLRKLSLVDRDGNVRIQSSGGSVWEFFDAEGNLRSLIGTPHGAVAITLFDSNRKERIAIVAADGGSAEIRQRGFTGRTRIHQTTSPDGDATIELLTETGEQAWSESSQ